MGWNGTHSDLTKEQARKILPAKACKICVYWVRVLIECNDFQKPTPFESTPDLKPYNSLTWAQVVKNEVDKAFKVHEEEMLEGTPLNLSTKEQIISNLFVSPGVFVEETSLTEYLTQYLGNESLVSLSDYGPTNPMFRYSPTNSKIKALLVRIKQSKSPKSRWYKQLHRLQKSQLKLDLSENELAKLAFKLGVVEPVSIAKVTWINSDEV